MATWNAENSLLTQKGEEILNKISIGEGSITISKIVAGSGRVPDSKLYTQTSISGITKEFTINSYNPRDEGTEINFQITNAGLTEDFSLNQIGVYVTHPDYGGEVLYHISQCDYDREDIIPASGNAVTLIYSLYLVHGNSSAITLNIDPSGMVTNEVFENFKSTTDGKLSDIENSISANSEAISATDENVTKVNNSVTALSNAFNAFKKNLKAGKLVAVDSNGNLIASGKNVVSGGSISVTDAITHRALSLSVEGKSTQTGTPTPSAPIYPVDSKVSYIRVTDGSNPKLINFPSVIELRSLGDYEDTIEWDGSKWWKVQ